MITALVGLLIPGLFASSTSESWLLWGLLGLAFAALYLGVYAFIRTKWGHSASENRMPDDVPSEPDLTTDQAQRDVRGMS